jgi:hypothetical protein
VNPWDYLGRKDYVNLKNSLIGYRTRDLPVCSIVPQPLRYSARPWVFISFWRTSECSLASEERVCRIDLAWWSRESCFINLTEPISSGMWMRSRAPNFLHGSLVNSNAREECWLWSRKSITRIALHQQQATMNAMPNMASMNTAMEMLIPRL